VRYKMPLAMTLLVLLVAAASTVQADVLRVVVVETSDEAAYVKAVEHGRQLLARKGSPARIRLYKARFAGTEAGTLKVSIHYPSLEALAKDLTLMKSDPEVKDWLAGLDRIRTVVSDSIYEEIAP
jgi:hypothetical protein